LQRCLQRLLPTHIPPGPAQVAYSVGDVASEDLPQPGGKLLLAPPAELVDRLVSLQQGLLDDVRRVHLDPHPWVELGPSQQAQVVTILVERTAVGLLTHPRPSLCTGTAAVPTMRRDVENAVGPNQQGSFPSGPNSRPHDRAA